MPYRMLPREKAKEYGISSLSDSELLAIIIKTAYVHKTVYEMADEIIEKAGGFENLFSLSYEELVNIKGIKDAKALEILPILEIARRLSKVDIISEGMLDSPDKVVEWLRFKLGYGNQEEFLVIYLNKKGNVIKSEVLFKGNKNSSIVGIDEIFRKAILLKASAIIAAHNHPGGDVNPSHNDIELTERLKEVSNMLQIPLLDHLIVSKEDYFSFKNHGLL